MKCVCDQRRKTYRIYFFSSVDSANWRIQVVSAEDPSCGSAKDLKTLWTKLEADENAAIFKHQLTVKFVGGTLI